MKKILAIVLCLVMVLSLLPTVSFAATENYTKVTSEQEDWSGTYLIAYASGSDAYVYTGVDAAKNSVKVTNGTEISATDGMCAVLVEKFGSGYSMKLLSGTNVGKYLSGNGSSNGTKFSTTAVELSISYTDGHTVIKDGTAPFQFNKDSNNLRFRFFTKGTQQGIDLYKLTASCDHVWDDGEVTTPATCTTAGEMTYTCTKNNCTKTETIAALGHKFENGVCVNDGCSAKELTGTLVNELKDGQNVVIFNPSNDVAATNEEYTYSGTSGNKQELVTVSGTVTGGVLHTTDAAAVLTVKVADGHYSFVNADGKYLYMDSTHVKFVGEAGDYTIFDLEKVDDGYYIKSVNAVYSYTNKDTQETVNKPQYLEYFAGHLSVYSLNTSKAGIYTFQFFCTHADTEVKNDKEATCVAVGYTGDTYCKDCGTKLSSGTEIPASGEHKGGTATCTQKKQCEVCGQEYGELGAHKGELNWAETKGGHIQMYGGCGCTVGEVEEHDHDGENGICSKCGLGCEHSGGEATCKSPAICETCGNPYGEKNADNHKGETEVTGKVDATCGKDGYTGDTICKDCGKTIKLGETIPATGKHADGNKDHKCDVCEKVLSECADTDKDHKCDVCGNELSKCVDENNDGKCDICGAAVETKPDDKKDDEKEDDKKDDKPVADPNSITGQLVTSLKDGMHIIIYNPGDGVIATGREYTYEEMNNDGSIASSKQELETAAATVSGKTLTAAKADACVLTVKRVNGHYSFVTSDGKYLYMDKNEVKFVDKAGDYTLFDLEKADGGYYIKSVNAVYSYTDKNTNETVNKPQYLELYKGYLTVYSLNTSKANIYTFNFYTTDEISDNTGDPIAVVLGLLAVSGLGITVLKKKEH